MATQKTDFLKFNAYSMKDLITRKMSEDSKFTDQIYEGSNLAILIDLVAYMYQCLVYQLNNAAAESMFSDTQIYENISRLVKMIGYNPKGCKPAKFDIYVDRTVEEDRDTNTMTFILPYSYIDTELMDKYGNPIYFSTYKNSPTDGTPITIESENYHEVSLVNGKWKMYPTIFTASGIPNEVFTINTFDPKNDEVNNVAGDFIDVYIKRPTETDFDFISFYQDKEELLMGVSQRNSQDDTGGASQRFSIYSNNDPVYSIRMNENKNFEIKFGDGITCQKLNKGDQIYIFYLETNGVDGEIDIRNIPELSNKKFVHSRGEFGLNKDDYEKLFKINDKNIYLSDDSENVKKMYNLLIKSQITTKAYPEESVEDIKKNAPNWFKTGNRLLTRADYEQFIKYNVGGVIDVKCMNNWEYLTTFHKWLYNCGVKYHPEVEIPGRYYFEENRFHINNFNVVDAADANNIYLWIKLQDDSITLDTFKSVLDNAGINNLKIMTSELQLVSPIPVIFDICAGYQDVGQMYAKNSDFQTFVSKATYDSYIEITLNDDCMYVNSFISEQIRKIFTEYFSPINLRIGQNINSSEILDRIYSINGVQRVRTVFNPQYGLYEYIDPSMNTPRAVDGLSFISYSNGFIDFGEDVNIGNVTRQIEDFQFPVFNDQTVKNLSSKIKIIKKQMSNISSIKF